MAKYLFTTERLSIQVHPDDATARQRGYPRGKDECWIVLDAGEDAELGIGTVRDVPLDELMAAARDGSIVDLMDWRRPKKGDFIYNPAGTIHALGPGLTVLEIQQAVDLTYRLYDYGRPRELHLEEAADVVRPTAPQPSARYQRERREPRAGRRPAFRRRLVRRRAASASRRDARCPAVADRRAGRRVAPGECALIDAEHARDLTSGGTFVLAWSTEPWSS